MKRVKDVLSRLRAALTSQAAVLLAAAMLLGWLALSAQRTGETPLEKRVAQTLSSMEGAGRVTVTIRTREVSVSGGTFGAASGEAVPCGAVAVAQGADDPLVEMQLRQALCALLGLPAASVSVVTGGK